MCLGLKQSQLSEDDDFHCYACKGETNPADDPDFDLEKVGFFDVRFALVEVLLFSCCK